MLKIGNFSKLSRISIRMLRHYDELGLLTPEHVDSFTNYRYYGEAQLLTASRITGLKDMGFSLAVIAIVLTNYDDVEARSEFLILKQQEVSLQVEEAQQRLQLLETAINWLRRDTTAMNYTVLLKELPQRYVASVRKTIPSYDQEGMLWGMLMGETATLSLKDADPCYALAIFHDQEYKEINVDVEVQKLVSGRYANTENVVFKTEPAVKIASATYTGSYAQISSINQAVANWVSDSDYVFDGAMFNIYHVSPHETQNPDEYVTEVCYPIKKK